MKLNVNAGMKKQNHAQAGVFDRKACVFFLVTFCNAFHKQTSILTWCPQGQVQTFLKFKSRIQQEQVKVNVKKKKNRVDPNINTLVKKKKKKKKVLFTNYPQYELAIYISVLFFWEIPSNFSAPEHLTEGFTTKLFLSASQFPPPDMGVCVWKSWNLEAT